MAERKRVSTDGATTSSTADAMCHYNLTPVGKRQVNRDVKTQRPPQREACSENWCVILGGSRGDNLSGNVHSRDR